MPKAIVSGRPVAKPTSDHINEQRKQLFKAHAIVNCVRFAVASQDSGLDETDITWALRVTAETLDNVAAALEQGGAS
jgi:hypothetical protein